MSSVIQQLRSAIAGNAPSSLAPGQLAINIIDGKMWFGDQSSNPQPLAFRMYFQEGTPAGPDLLDRDLWWKPSSKALSIYSSGQWVFAGLPTTGGLLIGNIQVDISGNRVFETTSTGAKTTGIHEVTKECKVSSTVNRPAAFGTYDAAAGGFWYNGQQLRHVPAGSITFWAGGTTVPEVPFGWLVADGSLYAQSLYPDLYAAIGVRYNLVTDIAGYFRLPDLRGLFPRFANLTRSDAWKDPEQATRVRADGITIPADGSAGTLQGEETGPHTHRVMDGIGGDNTNGVLGNGSTSPNFSGQNRALQSGDGDFNDANHTDGYTYGVGDDINGAGNLIQDAEGLESRPINIALVGLIKL